MCQINLTGWLNVTTSALNLLFEVTSHSEYRQSDASPLPAACMSAIMPHCLKDKLQLRMLYPLIFLFSFLFFNWVFTKCPPLQCWWSGLPQRRHRDASLLFPVQYELTLTCPIVESRTRVFALYVWKRASAAAVWLCYWLPSVKMRFIKLWGRALRQQQCKQGRSVLPSQFLLSSFLLQLLFAASNKWAG